MLRNGKISAVSLTGDAGKPGDVRDDGCRIIDTMDFSVTDDSDPMLVDFECPANLNRSSISFETPEEKARRKGNRLKLMVILNCSGIIAILMLLVTLMKKMNIYLVHQRHHVLQTTVVRADAS